LLVEPGARLLVGDLDHVAALRPSRRLPLATLLALACAAGAFSLELAATCGAALLALLAASLASALFAFAALGATALLGCALRSAALEPAAVGRGATRGHRPRGRPVRG
jgi:hypothetical protein